MGLLGVGGDGPGGWCKDDYCVEYVTVYQCLCI